MPKISGKVIKSGEKDGKFLALVQLNGKFPKAGELISLKWGRGRSNSQNSFLWLYYDWLLNADEGLKADYIDSENFHEAMKATFLSERIFKNGLEFIKVKSTTTLNKDEFGQFLESVKNAMNEYYGINDAEFWSCYQENYAAI